MTDKNFNVKQQTNKSSKQDKKKISPSRRVKKEKLSGFV
jgi:hypothetical protein